ncbi:MAG: hypothetical protein K6U89_20385 [Chloroflexi bacterium]|nr:hypothetical protein [Chloroflexota bacterium]
MIKHVALVESRFKDGEKRLLVQFEIGNGYVLSKYYTPILTKKSKLSALISELGYRLERGQLFNVATIIGQKCLVTLLKKTSESGESYNKIEDVRRARQKNEEKN